VAGLVRASFFATAFALLSLTPVAAEPVDGTVSVSAGIGARLSIAISDNSATFGANVGPDGSNTGGEVSSVIGSVGNQGAYYVWSTDPEPLVRVRSNRTWNGTVRASETTGNAASMTVASGVLRWRTDAPASYADAAASTAFTTTNAVWQTNHAAGAAEFVYYYLLRVDWDDDLGTFRSVVTYSATQ
jgi:hypothetical protein